MIDRRLKLFQNLEKFLGERFPESKGILPFEEPPPIAQGFDLAFPCFALAKTLKENPQAIAEKLETAIKSDASKLGVEDTKVIKGFVNLRFQASALAEALLEQSGPLGESKTALKNEKVIVEFSSPNIAKPFGIGHLRSTNIGAAIARIYSALGAQVIRINHLGDWGTQFGKMIVAYKKFGSAEFVKGDPVNNLYKLYVEFHEKEEKDPALMDEARDAFVKLENGDAEATELWTWFKDVSYYEFKRIYDRLGVDFDYVTGESFYNKLMLKTVEQLEKLKLLKESDQAMIVDLEPYGMPPCLVKKSDGATLYSTRDLAAAEYRARTFSPSKMVYVVGGEQQLHFRQIFKVLELMGYAWAKNCAHVYFGLIKFPEGKMSTRKGNLILLEDVLDQSVQRALDIVRAKNEDKAEGKRLTETEMSDVAEKVGTGAVVFFDLRAKRTKDVQFQWEDILNFEGDSGPYLQYTAVRLQSLLEKAEQEGLSVKAAKKFSLNLTTQEERDLIRKLLGFPAVIEAAAKENEPSIISHELLDLAAVFNRFYMAVPILKGDVDEKIGRLKIVESTKAVIQTGLGLLGIECPQRM